MPVPPFPAPPRLRHRALLAVLFAATPARAEDASRATVAFANAT